MRNYRHFAVGMKANGSTIERIVKPTDLNAYTPQWHGNPRFENPKYYNIVLANGSVYKDTELMQVITDEGDMSWEVVQ